MGKQREIWDEWSRSSVRGLAVACALSVSAMSPLPAQEPAAQADPAAKTAAPESATEEPAADPAEAPPPLTDAQASEMIERIRNLILPQQKEAAQELIRKYPNSRIAKIAQDLLDEYMLYDNLEAQSRQNQIARDTMIREFWRHYYPPYEKVVPVQTQIVNRSDRSVLYQLKGPEMEWAGPFRLAIGETHTVNYPVLFRRVTADGIMEYTLPQGIQCVFKNAAETEQPKLYRVP